MRWPATGKPSGVGSDAMATNAAIPSRRPQWTRSQDGCAVDDDVVVTGATRRVCAAAIALSPLGSGVA
jgi:hypothetical protein